jgi:hypothetical protein
MGDNVCQVDDCQEPVHARGYCRKHYGRLWRRAKQGNGSAPGNGHHKTQAPKKDQTDRLRTLERELRRAEELYRAVVGLQGRMKWRREMEAVKAEIRKIDENYFC